MIYIRIALLMMMMGWLSASAQDGEEIRFSHIGLKEGLSHSTVYDITQDREGYIWVATHDGVNKYDGYDFRVYRKDSGSESGLSGSITTCLAVDNKGRVWIGTNEGLSLYNANMDCFINYYCVRKFRTEEITRILPLTDDRLLVSTLHEFVFFNIKTSKFENTPFTSHLRFDSYSDMIRENNTIYLGTNHIYTYSLKSAKLNRLVILPDGVNVLSLLKRGNQLWIGTEGTGLFIYHFDSRKLDHYTSKNTPGIHSDYVRSLALDGQQRIWIGTYNGLVIFHNGIFSSFESSFINEGSLSQNSVRSIFRDAQQGMWLGTYWGGLNYYHPLLTRFTNIRHIPFVNSLNDNVVSCIVEDKKGNFWIGTSNGGVNYYNSNTRRFTTPVTDASFRDVKAVYIDPFSEDIYIGAHHGNGFLVIDGHTGRQRVINASNSNLPSNDIYSFVSDGTPYGLWVASLSGLLHYDKRMNRFKTYVRDETGKDIQPFTQLLFRDSRQNLWVGGKEGLTSYRQHGLSLAPNLDYEIPEGLKDAYIYSISESDAHNAVYVGSNNGLFILYQHRKNYRQYTRFNGLSGNTVYSALEDENGDLWISTNQGLSCLNLETGKFRNFTILDGLQSNQFNPGSYCRDMAGMMYFGGVNGITKFNPLTLKMNPYTPRPLITRLTVFNKEISPQTGKGILEKAIDRCNEIVLKPSQNSFSLEFAVPNYVAGRHNTFSYKLDGYDKEWRMTENLRVASYSNLPAGNYTFYVKAANNDGVWGKNPTVLKVRILPAWYCTWWAILLFVALGLLVAYQILRFFWGRKMMQAQLRLEKIDKKRQEEVNQMKIRFYVNMSHEIRTPLTLIVAPLQELLRRVTHGWEREQLNYIARNTNRLLHIVNQVMNYRKTEMGAFQLHVRHVDIVKAASATFNLFEREAREKYIHYELHNEVPERSNIICDPDYVELILNNLISNAFKYSNERDAISLTLALKDDYLMLQVTDTGIGIAPEEQELIFNRFYQVENGHGGNGIGLSLVQKLVQSHHGKISLESKVGEGSTFTVYLPQRRGLYTNEELKSLDRSSHTITLEEMEQSAVSVVEGKNSSDNKSESNVTIGETVHTILVVEDNDEMRRYICNGLSCEFKVVEAGNGKEALTCLEENPEVDILVTDVMMPVMNGVELCKIVKTDIRTCHIPVFFLSAKADVTYQLEGLECGANDYIPKPFSMDVLKSKIRNTLKTRDLMLAYYAKTVDVKPEKIVTNTLDEKFLSKAIAIIEKNMDNVAFSTEQFASEMNMSRSSLYLKLKAITGKSANDLIYKVKFKYACQLLLEGCHNVSEVSYMTGFNTPSYFSTCFKKYVGCLPTEYGKHPENNAS